MQPETNFEIVDIPSEFQSLTEELSTKLSGFINSSERNKKRFDETQIGVLISVLNDILRNPSFSYEFKITLIHLLSRKKQQNKETYEELFNLISLEGIKLNKIGPSRSEFYEFKGEYYYFTLSQLSPFRNILWTRLNPKLLKLAPKAPTLIWLVSNYRICIVLDKEILTHMIKNPDSYLIAQDLKNGKRLGYDLKYYIQKNGRSELRIIKNSPNRSKERNPKEDFDAIPGMKIINAWDNVPWSSAIYNSQDGLSPKDTMEALEIAFDLIKLLKRTQGSKKEIIEYGIKKMRQNILFVQTETLWARFDEMVEISFGKYQKSKVIERLIMYYLDNPNFVSLIEIPITEKTKNVNVTVNYLIWKEFRELIRNKYRKTKIQSQVIHSILTAIFEGKEFQEVSDFLRLIYTRYETAGEAIKRTDMKSLNQEIYPLEIIKSVNFEAEDVEFIKLKQLRNIIVHSTGKIPLEMLYKSLDLLDDSEFLELISLIAKSIFHIDWNKRQLIIQR